MNPAPYARIAAEIRARITSGELRPGDRVPSTRQITQDWGVAMATATKVLGTLRAEGLVRAVPGVGTVVHDEPAPARPARQRTAEPELNREAVIRAAIEVADAEGLHSLSMRRVATELGAATMSLYRHVSGKDELVTLMADTCFAEEPLPEARPDGWRARLELSSRLQWRLYRRHSWLAQSISMTRPQPMPHLLLHSDWALYALGGLGLSAQQRFYYYVTVFGYVRGTAANLEPEAEAERDTGMDMDEWMDARSAAFQRLIGSMQIPAFVEMMHSGGLDLDLDALFELGLRWILDGLAASLER